MKNKLMTTAILVAALSVAGERAAAAEQACSNYAGSWEQTHYNDSPASDTITLRIVTVAADCSFQARFDGAVHHFVSGTLNGPMRIHRDASGCTSTLSGRIDGLGSDGLRWTINQADPRCGVPPGFSETRTFRRLLGDAPITVSGSYKHTSAPGTWSRGLPTTMYCGNSPESWVRGNATLDRSSGLFSMTVQLETDSTSGGPKGRVSAALRDASGNTIATATSDEIGTGGKSPGGAAIRAFTSQVFIAPAVARRVQSIWLDAQCTGSIDRLWNVRLGTVQDAFKIILAVAGSL